VSPVEVWGWIASTKRAFVLRAITQLEERAEIERKKKEVKGIT
jgi:hypothetical protein